MKVSRGEIVEVNYPLPKGIFKPHPVIVLSDSNVNDFEEAFICAMISGVDVNDEFTFQL
ncbi:MAG: type II toxin-antitoxin system PemK/MazF family toxin [Bacteroidia bacterium]|nr:type II toxin-antitoxin system PemK/MazF family toxin [Bacteroidia bacterium]